MSKELEALNELRENLDFEGCLDFINEKKITDIKQALQRLEAIDNAKPSEALVCLERVANYEVENHIKEGWNIILYEVMQREINTIKQYILKAQEQEKVLEIIKQKKVDIWKFIDNGIFNYSYDDYYFCWNYYSCEKLTKEEFDLLKRWLNE